jgi:Zn-dependent peptidase ImmA (M78 family)/transcriptional regulator with XRE-family HTH domain
MLRVEVKPELLTWARERAGRNLASLVNRFPKIGLWESGEQKPTLKQLEAFAKAVHVPVGYLFLSSPPEEELPIPDMRTPGNRFLGSASADLLDILYLCQRRQAWYRDYARTTGEVPLEFAGSVSINASIIETAQAMRDILRFNIEDRKNCPAWTEALRRFIQQAEDIGVLIMISGVVGSNNQRKLDPDEFRGFALADDLAPLVFINGADTKAAQMFTLAHELAHLWLGQSALSDQSANLFSSKKIERWCNAVAAELLVPESALRKEVLGKMPLNMVSELARKFKVSTLVILRRLYDLKKINKPQFHQSYSRELHKLISIPRSSGGDFYLTQEVRASRRFVHALVASTLEGQTLYRDAFQLLTIKKEKTFLELGARMGISL